MLRVLLVFSQAAFWSCRTCIVGLSPVSREKAIESEVPKRSETQPPVWWLTVKRQYLEKVDDRGKHLQFLPYVARRKRSTRVASTVNCIGRSRCLRGGGGTESGALALRRREPEEQQHVNVNNVKTTSVIVSCRHSIFESDGDRLQYTVRTRTHL
ncbi:hypothetical protein EYF80_034543 [Liparis tanakae]|uniref:Secreted protein n=1 Tax=Liparis tanakae TaxID=230148 RepID=A0A4Z2GNZ6_9TELE|nr:hypothetical protein EYF80_034543 [Liparis tanakae]